ncbi:MAG TPA: hypothetical protein PKH95_03690 [Candidatus Magasanikbacteria bacterium]|nr:hypothetical protein [Candidatus Magasanikbacteria bacterium]
MEENNKFKILFESIKSKFDYLSNADNCLDSKAGTLMGFEITLGIGYLSFVIGGLEGIKLYEGVIGLALLAISTILLLIVNWPKNYITISVNLFEHKEYLEKSEKDLFLQLTSDAQNAFTENNKILKTKVKLYRFAITLLIISSSLLILSKVGKFYV